jgi:threonine/homoserine/homoserine lactone efflux protein
VNVFVVSQALKRDFLHGFMAGLTAALLDAIYCLVAIFGLSLVTFGLNPVKFLPFIKLIAAAILLILGIRVHRQSKTYKEPPSPRNITSFSPRPMLGVALLYVSNPSLYIFWLAVAGMVSHHHWVTSSADSARIFFAAACGIGSTLWYFILTHYVAKHHHQLQPKTFQKILFFLALILFSFSAYTVASIFFKSLKLL